jgi:hypothetical protein
MVAGSRACLTFILSDHPHRPSRHFDGALASVLATQQNHPSMSGWSGSSQLDTPIDFLVQSPRDVTSLVPDLDNLAAVRPVVGEVLGFERRPCPIGRGRGPCGLARSTRCCSGSRT